MSAIAQRFDEAAPHYDKAATLQARVAKRLVAWAQPERVPHHALDIGAGTGFVVESMARRWPTIYPSALDVSPGMLRAAQKKIPSLQIISGDAAQIQPQEKFDIIFSSMMLHWLPQPRESLQRWQNWLKPGGRLYVALLTEGSFKEWQDLCRTNNLTDGLWVMPQFGFATDLAIQTKHEVISISYPCVADFLHRLKSTGAATPRQGHKPFSIPVMRHLMAVVPQPFTVSYEILYLELTTRRDF